MSEDDSCWIYKGWRNYTDSQVLIPLGYEGIPQNFVFNFIGFMIMVTIFSLLRKRAWNYGRLAFYKRGSESGVSNYDIETENIYPPNWPRRHHSTTTPDSVTISPTVSAPVRDQAINDDGMFTWIITTLKLTDEQYLYKCGPDAVRYLSFQRHLLFLGSVIAVVSICVALPINFQGGTLRSYIWNFKSSTITNLDANATYLWVHILMTLVFLLVAIAVLRHFSRTLHVSEEKDPRDTRTVMITRIAKKYLRPDKLENHFLEIFPDLEIEEISFAYNITGIELAQYYRHGAASAKKYWEKYLVRRGVRPTMLPYDCGRICCRCCGPCGCRRVDAIDYYTEEEAKYKKLLEEEIDKSLARSLGIAFVTFTNHKMAKLVARKYYWISQLLLQGPRSQFSRKLKSDQWIVEFAPQPDDIYWENISLSYRAWWFKFIIVNTALLAFVLVYTTPVHILNALGNLVVTEDPDGHQRSFVERIRSWGGIITKGLFTDTAPTLFLWIVAVSVPSLVSLTDRMVGYWTRTSENRSRMIKTLVYLLFTVIILPSVGARSIYVYIIRPTSGDTGILQSFRCIFYTGNGVFFINYIITSSFLGIASELMRLPELLHYAVRLCCAKSSAETKVIRQTSVWDFQFGAQYAWTMLNFTMFVIYSPVCPVITPFGILYLCMKHYVDRYNIYFAYAPCQIDKNVHLTAISFVIGAMFLLQIVILIYCHTRTSSGGGLLTIFAIITFVLSAALLISQVCFNSCSKLSPISFVPAAKKEDTEVAELLARSVSSRIDLTKERHHEPLERSRDFDDLHYVNPPDADGTGSRLGRYFPKILRALHIEEGKLYNMYKRSFFPHSVHRPPSSLNNDSNYATARQSLEDNLGS